LAAPAPKRRCPPAPITSSPPSCWQAAHRVRRASRRARNHRQELRSTHSPRRRSGERQSRRDQSSGSTFTSRWSWFEPTQNVTGVVALSTNTVRKLVSSIGCGFDWLAHRAVPSMRVMTCVHSSASWVERTMRIEPFLCAVTTTPSIAPSASDVTSPVRAAGAASSARVGEGMACCRRHT
jgi:hypothetical protein